MDTEDREKLTTVIGQIIATISDDPRAVDVDVFVEKWDRLWGDGRTMLREGLETLCAILDDPNVEVTPNMLSMIVDMLRQTSEYVEAMSEKNAPTYEQRMEARAIRIERKLDALLERSDRW